MRFYMAISLTLETTAYALDQLLALPEAQIALAGRSNVGKSSLINALAGRKKLAKVSATPGKTRSVNFYRVEPSQLIWWICPAMLRQGPAMRAPQMGRSCWSTTLRIARPLRRWPCCWIAACLHKADRTGVLRPWLPPAAAARADQGR